MKNLLSINDLSKEKIINIIENSITIKNGNKITVSHDSYIENKIIGLLFFEPSTRTRFSFETAIYKSKGNVLNYNEKISSVKKGETLYDTIKTMEIYCDLFIIRHPDNDIFEKITKYTSKPIINAGNGTCEHPTQSLIDVTTMFEHNKNTNSTFKNILFVGDINNSRTINSLIKCIYKISNSINFYIYSIQEDFNTKIKNFIKNNNIKITRVFSYDECIRDMDFVYVTRCQKERQNLDIIDYKKEMIITPNVMKKMKPTCGLLHPFPRNEEIDIKCDSDSRSLYFKQIENGIHVRKIIMECILSEITEYKKVRSYGTLDGGYMYSEEY
tara:strand:+ start:172 stop:1155 length:984 start_codon:yes stop_codon:yes gene_type:complete